MKIRHLLLTLALLGTANAQFVQESKAIIKDTKTNLLWQDEEVVKKQTLNFKDANAYCKGLKLNGITGWELPSFLELFSIVDTKVYNPTLSKKFQNFVPDNYWTTKTFGHGTSGEAFVIDFKSGAFNRKKMDEPYYVRCVKKTN